MLNNPCFSQVPHYWTNLRWPCPMRICLWMSCLTACCVWRRSGWSKLKPLTGDTSPFSCELSLRARAFVFQQGQSALQVLQSGRAREGGHPEGPGSSGSHGPRWGGQRQAPEVLDDGTQQNIQEPFNDGCARGGEEPQPVTNRSGGGGEGNGAGKREILKKYLLLWFPFIISLLRTDWIPQWE